MAHSSVDSALFRQLCGRFATGVVVLTAVDQEGHPHGMTANSFASVSLDPPLVSVNVELVADFHRVIAEAQRFTINVLEARQENVSRHFAGKEPHQFEGYRRTQSGQIVLAGVIAAIECMVHSRFDVGDHTIVVGQVVGGETDDGKPLLYFRGGYHNLA